MAGAETWVGTRAGAEPVAGMREGAGIQVETGSREGKVMPLTVGDMKPKLLKDVLLILNNDKKKMILKLNSRFKSEFNANKVVR